MAVSVNVKRRRINKDYSSSNSTYIVKSVSSSEHTESAIVELTSESSYTYEYTFLTEFTDTPLLSVFSVYKVVEQAPGKYRRQDVPYYHGTEFPLTSGFEITIDELFTADLAGVIIEFKFEKA